MPSYERVAQGLRGFGAGVAGRGAEFQAGLQAQRDKLDDNRKMAAVEDSLTIQSALNQGDVGLARDTLMNRIEAIGSLGGDPGDSVDLLGLLDSGNFEGALREVGTVVDYATRSGFLESPTAATAPKQQIVNGQVVTMDGSGGANAVPISGFTPKEKAGPLVTIAGENAEDKAMGSIRAKQYERVTTEAEKSFAMIESLDQMDAIDVDTGIFEPFKGQMSSIARGLGISTDGIDRAATSQAYQAATGRLVNSVLQAASGPQTDGDADRARATMAQLGSEPGANKFKNDSLRAVALRKIEQSEFIDRVMEGPDGTGGVSFSKAAKEWNKFKRATPNLSATIKNPNTGLPLYFYQFKQSSEKRRPGISQAEIIKAWRQINAK